MSEAFNPRRFYREHKPRLKRLAKEVRFELASDLGSTDIKLHGMTVRVKTRDSYIEKIVRKNYNNPLIEVEDLVGARIVCLYASDLKLVISRVTDLFDVLNTDDKVNSGPTDAFGYMSMHLICRVPRRLSGPRYSGLHDIKFEVQIRTILMDAWANVSHHLAYKGDTSIPDPLKRDFHALAGLFHVADSHFELLSSRAAKADEDAQRPAAAEEQNLPESTSLNRATLQAYIDRSFTERQTIQPTDTESVSDLVEELANFGYTTIEQIDDDIRPNLSAIREYEIARPPLDDKLRLYTAVGLLRTGVAIANREYASAKYPEEAEDFARLHQGHGMDSRR